jgi:hypothetical protein
VAISICGAALYANSYAVQLFAEFCSLFYMILAGLEPAVFGSEDQRFIHQATGPISGVSGHHHISAARAAAPLKLFQLFLQGVPDTSPKLIQDASNYFMAARPRLSARVF